MATAQKLNVAYGLDNPLQTLASLPIQSKRAPTTRDRAQIGQIWVNKLTNTVYMCTSIVANVTQWTNLVGGGTGIFLAVEATTGNITADMGDIVATAGEVNAGTTITAGTGITATTGDITATTGNVNIIAGDLVLPGGVVIATGAGVPAFNAPVGSLYINTTAAAQNTRVYVAVDAVGTWTALNTVA